MNVSVSNVRTNEDMRIRGFLQRGMNKAQSYDSINGYQRQVTPFRAFMTAGDYLNRPLFRDPQTPSPNQPMRIGSFPVGVRNGPTLQSDGTGVTGFAGNQRQVYRMSDYLFYRKARAHHTQFKRE